jgi:prepilin-type N-terminal cleavage/methylation domain-containing protein
MFGFSLIEIIVAMSILGILAAIGASAYRTPGARLYSNDVRALVQQARYEAIRQNAPVAVVWNPGLSAFQTVLGTLAQPCQDATVLNTTAATRYPRVTVDVEFVDGLVWLPSGQARNCSYGPFSAVIATIGDGRDERVVTVTLTGRVTIE